MIPTLRLTLTDYHDATRWRWVLYDSRGRFLADYEVHLDPTSREYAGFLNLGTWIGDRVFGGLCDTLWQHWVSPAAAVHAGV